MLLRLLYLHDMVFTFSYYNELTNHSASQMNDIWGRDRVYYKSFNHSMYFVRCLFLTFANSLDLDQVRPNIGPGLDLN